MTERPAVDILTPNVLHAPVLAALHAEAFASPWPAEDFALLLKDPGAVVRLAVDAGGVPLGFVLCRAVADEAEVLTIAVAPGRRRHGLGRVLMRAAGEALAAAGVVTLFLEVAEDNAAARTLYDRLGFAMVGRRKGYYARSPEPPVDALVLSAPLPLERGPAAPVGGF